MFTLIRLLAWKAANAAESSSRGGGGGGGGRRAGGVSWRPQSALRRYACGYSRQDFDLDLTSARVESTGSGSGSSVGGVAVWPSCGFVGVADPPGLVWIDR